MHSRHRLLAAVPLLMAACHGAGPYGHAPLYEPHSNEKAAVAPAKEFDPVMVRRFPEQWRDQPLTLFGVVTNRAAGPGGAAYLTLSVRRLEPRNLCQSAEDSDSCRVTVSDTDFGVVHAVVALTDADDTGADAVRAGSLLRIVGTLAQDVDGADGAPILRTTYYRAWPPGTYVTKSASSVMRQ